MATGSNFVAAKFAAEADLALLESQCQISAYEPLSYGADLLVLDAIALPSELLFFGDTTTKTSTAETLARRHVHRWINPPSRQMLEHATDTRRGIVLHSNALVGSQSCCRASIVSAVCVLN
jgi:hypothetical protein